MSLAAQKGPVPVTNRNIRVDRVVRGGIPGPSWLRTQHSICGAKDRREWLLIGGMTYQLRGVSPLLRAQWTCGRRSIKPADDEACRPLA